MCRRHAFFSWFLAGAVLSTVGMAEAPRLHAQRIHVLVVSDASDWAHWGVLQPNIQVDVAEVSAMFHNNIPKEQLDYVSLAFDGDEGGAPSTILKAIQEFQVGPDDAVVFYYTGHGGADDRGHYLAMEKGKLYRAELRRSMLAKRPRLAVIMTDCCNVRADGRAFAAPAVDVNSPKVVTPLFRSLFIEPRGVVDINSSAPDQSSFFFVKRDQFGRHQGSLFTRSLTRFVDRQRDRTGSWDMLVREVDLAVQVAFRKNYPRGAKVAKGRVEQNRQDIYAVEYPGMPAKRGPRTGLTVRDSSGAAVLITAVAKSSPASRVYDLKADRYVTLRPGLVIRSANGKRVTSVEQLREIVRQSARILRLEVGPPAGPSNEYLIQMKY